MTNEKTAVIAFGGSRYIMNDPENFGLEYSENHVIKTNSDVTVNLSDGLLDSATLYIYFEVSDISQNVADKSGTSATIVKSANVTEDEAPFGPGVGFIKIRYVMP